MAEPAAQRYFVVQTKPNAERYALDFLTNYRPYDHDRFTVYYPQVRVERRHAGRVDEVDRPFLPRTMFVLDDGRGTDKLKSAPGVSSLMRVGHDVARVRQSLINEFKQREISGYIQLDDDHPHFGRLWCPFKFNDRVTVRKQVGVSDLRIDALFGCRIGKDRAQVFTQILGAHCSTEVKISDLESVDG